VGAETRVLTILRLIIRWIASNILYSPAEFPRYPNETFSLGLGDCDDQSNLLIAFCRLLGIPAYLQLGCIYSPYYNQTSRFWSERLSIRQVKVSWHGWAMVYIPPWGWLPVDPTCVSGLILRVDQLNAITSSAVIQYYTFQYMNIVVTDYIAETRSLKNLLNPTSSIFMKKV
jgi:transglutaminase-like putative cysteine protease